MTDRDRRINVLAELLENLDDLPFYTYKDKAEYLIDEYGVIVPPCKVGQTVWFIRNKTEIIATAVEKIISKHGGLYLKLCHNSMYETTCRSIGKTVFLTKEEAMQKLKELKENDSSGIL